MTTQRMLVPDSFPEYTVTSDETRITEKWTVDGNVYTAKDDANLPVYGEAHTDVSIVKVVTVRIVPGDETLSYAFITWSNAAQAFPQGTDTSGSVVIDMMARTERQFWDKEEALGGSTDLPGIGANNEGVEVYRPHTELIYEILETAIDEDLISSLSGTVNSRQWKGRAAGTVLFIGARGRQQGTSRFRTEYHFLVDEVDGFKEARWRNYSDDKDGVRSYSAEQTATVVLDGNFNRLPV